MPQIPNYLQCQDLLDESLQHAAQLPEQSAILSRGLPSSGIETLLLQANSTVDVQVGVQVGMQVGMQVAMQVSVAMLEHDQTITWFRLQGRAMECTRCTRLGMLFCHDLIRLDLPFYEVMDARASEYAADEVVLFHQQARYLAGVPIHDRGERVGVLLCTHREPEQHAKLSPLMVDYARRVETMML